MTILSAQHGVLFTTKALSFDQAQRFAGCIRANSQYELAEVSPAPRNSGKSVVSYRATDPQRIAKLTSAFQGSREERANAQADCYTLRTLACGIVEVANLVNGNVYAVLPNGDCDCKDATHRTNGNAVLCKHAILAQNHRLAEREACDAHAAWCRGQAERERQLLSSRMSADFGDGSW